MDIRDSKRELRARMTGVRSRISPESRSRQSLEACIHADREVLRPLRARKGSNLTVFSYLSFRDEPDTRPLLRNCLEQGDVVLVPRVTGNDRMTLHLLPGEQDLVPGIWGISEPDSHIPEWPVSRYGEIDLVLVPGLAYDLQGGRIGFGAGYYDRFMAELMNALEARTKDEKAVLRAALSFREQVVSGLIPMEEHDFKLDLLFTASGTIYIEGK
ncbi:5-formyltetrahydrofolate cyclo-ligase [Fontibacillus sp. BL9]|uniref:5-formyltetrahydrofolate cyclo-ligase n=1 Tax=Fontibacillus sp. BL9 TaxID=3389971 RepID=UPI00397B8479